MQSYSSLIYSRPSFKNITNELEIKTDQSKNNSSDENLIINYKDFQKLSFQNLSFKYDRNYIFKDLNFSFKKNKITGIIGNTGKGKSTLLNIIIGLLKIENGSIILNENRKIEKNFKLDFSIGYVPQDTFLIDGTIAENIA